MVEEGQDGIRKRSNQGDAPASYADNKDSIQDGKNNLCKGPEVTMYPTCLQVSKRGQYGWWPWLGLGRQIRPMWYPSLDYTEPCKPLLLLWWDKAMGNFWAKWRHDLILQCELKRLLNFLHDSILFEKTYSWKTNRGFLLWPFPHQWLSLTCGTMWSQIIFHSTNRGVRPPLP